MRHLLSSQALHVHTSMQRVKYLRLDRYRCDCRLLYGYSRLYQLSPRELADSDNKTTQGTRGGLVFKYERIWSWKEFEHESAFSHFLFFGTYLRMLSGMAVVFGGWGWVVVRKMGRIEIGNETKEDSGINGWWDVAFVGGRDDVLSSGLCVKWITKRNYFCPRIQRLQGAHKLEEAVVRNQNLKTSWCCGMDDGYNSRMVSRRMEPIGIYCFWSVARSNWHLLRRFRRWIATD